MAVDLTSVILTTECSACSAPVPFPWRRVRIQRVAVCACGQLIGIKDRLVLEAVNRFIAEHSSPTVRNDT
jgi:hypothetical protein